METVKLHSERFGETGPALVLLHGLFGSGRNWYTLAQKFADEFRVYALDLRGHGNSPKVGPLDYPHMAADVQAWLAKEGLVAADFMGHSLGGKVAMTLALIAPKAVDKLVVVDIAPVPYAHSFDRIVKALKSVPLAQINNRRQADEHLALKIENPTLRQFLLQNLISQNGHYRWRIDLDLLASALPALADFPISSEAHSFAGPALFIGGERSEYLQPQHYQAILALFPNAEIKTIEGAGHWVHIDQPECFEAAVRSFLRGR